MIGGTIYFVQADVGGPIKIGFTAGDPQRRLIGLQVGSPFPLRLLHTIRGTPYHERELHERFAAQRSHGEWFYPCEELRALIHSSHYLENQPRLTGERVAEFRHPAVRQHGPLREGHQAVVDVLALPDVTWLCVAEMRKLSPFLAATRCSVPATWANALIRSGWPIHKRAIEEPETLRLRMQYRWAGRFGSHLVRTPEVAYATTGGNACA